MERSWRWGSGSQRPTGRGNHDGRYQQSVNFGSFLFQQIRDHALRVPRLRPLLNADARRNQQGRCVALSVSLNPQLRGERVSDPLGLRRPRRIDYSRLGTLRARFRTAIRRL